MKLKIELILDTEVSEDMAALAALAGLSTQVKASKAEAPAPEKKTKAAPAPALAPQPEPQPEPETQPESESEQPVTIEQIRSAVSGRVAKYRNEMMAKLKELGAPNVSQLKPENYQEFFTFVEGLN